MKPAMLKTEGSVRGESGSFEGDAPGKWRHFFICRTCKLADYLYTAER
jgi:hypothetical protein